MYYLAAQDPHAFVAGHMLLDLVQLPSLCSTEQTLSYHCSQHTGLLGAGLYVHICPDLRLCSLIGRGVYAFCYTGLLACLLV